MGDHDAAPSETLPSETLPEGAPIGGYTIRRILGQGGFGITYEAFNRVTGRTVAIKEFFPARMARRGSASQLVYSRTDAEMVTWALKKFEETTTTLCRLSHPGIVQVIDYVPANNTGYMIMELVEGTTFKDWLRGRDRAPTLDELRPLVEPAMDALAYVHAQGLVHRDIAPDNILITHDGRPVLIDFGSVSVDVGGVDHAGRSSTVGLSKRHYTAPEQMSAKTRPQAVADVYSMGAVVYRALTGLDPADGLERIDAMFLRKEADPYRPVAGMAASCPRRAATIIDKALDLRPDGRPRSIGDLRQGLWPAVAAPGPRATPAAGPVDSGSKPGPTGVAWIAAALIGVAAISAALIGFRWSHDGSSEPAPIASTSQAPASEPPAPAPIPSSPAPESPAPESPAPEPVPAEAPVGYRAALLVEAPDRKDKVETILGKVTWRLREAGDDAAAGPSVEADVTLPEANVTVVLAKNTDASLPASHTIKVSFAAQPGSPLRQIKQINVPQMRDENSPSGEALAGVTVPVVANVFLVGLSLGKDEAANLRLLTGKAWLDIPMLLGTGKIAKLTFEKGATGQRDFDQAVADWAKR